MAKIDLQTLGKQAREKRGEAGIRKTAKVIGISAATLSRVERGYLPDLETFGKFCKWLGVDPGEVLGVKEVVAVTPKVAVHFKKDRTLAPESARALADMILHAKRALVATQGDEKDEF